MAGSILRCSLLVVDASHSPWPAGRRERGVHDLALTNELGCKFRGTALLAGGAAQDEGVAAVLDDGLGAALAVGARDLGDRLEAQDAAAAELTQPRQRVLEPINLAEGVQFIDDEPQALIAFTAIHGLENGDAHPGGDHRAQRRDLACLVGQEQHAALTAVGSCCSLPDPLPHREGRGLLPRGVLESADGRTRDGTYGSEHLLVPRLKERPCRRAGQQQSDFLGRRAGEQPIELAVIAVRPLPWPAARRR